MSSCTVQGNFGAGSLGGGIYNAGTLTMSSCTVQGNAASGNYGHGGGVYNAGTLTMSSCTVQNNSAGSGQYDEGGGLFLSDTSNTTFFQTSICKNKPHNLHVVSGAEVYFQNYSYVADAGDYDGTMSFHVDFCGAALR